MSNAIDYSQLPKVDISEFKKMQFKLGSNKKQTFDILISRVEGYRRAVMELNYPELRSTYNESNESRLKRAVGFLINQSPDKVGDEMMHLKLIQSCAKEILSQLATLKREWIQERHGNMGYHIVECR